MNSVLLLHEHQYRTCILHADQYKTTGQPTKTKAVKTYQK